MKIRIGAALLASAVALASALPATAAQFVQDGAAMFSPSTVSALDSRIGSFHAQTGKEVVVVTVQSLNGQTVQQAAQQAFRDQNVNGTLIYIAKNDHRDYFQSGINETRTGTITGSDEASIRASMESSFKAEDYDGGISNAVGSILSLYHSHLGSLQQSRTGSASATYGTATQYGNTNAPVTGGGFHISMFWWIVLIVIGFLIVRSIFRSMSGPRYYGGGPMPGGPGYGGPGYGGPGWGGGYYGGGGGGFWSGLLGGLGGAWLGNELFGGNRGYYGGGTMIDPNVAGGVAPSTDSGMWQNDAGQFDNSGGSGGDWGSGGFGDSGGGFGGGDSGGSGGDGGSGGGW